MKKVIASALTFMIIFSNFTYNVSAAVTEGGKTDVLNSEYVVIVNTSSSDSQSTGKITFDESNTNTRISQENLVEYNSDSKELDSESEQLNENLINSHIQEQSSDEEEVKALQKAQNTIYNIGDQKTIGGRTYTVIGIGDKSYIWMENTLKSSYDNVQGKTDLAAKEMIRVYEGRPYEFLNELADNNIPYLDGSGKLSIFLEVTNNGSSGYYNNEKDITGIHINTQADPNSFNAGGFDNTNGLLVHEGQHALFNLLACNGQASISTSLFWFNEGMSVAVMDYLWGYYDNNGWLSKINNSVIVRNGTSLIYDSYRNSTVQDYSMQYLFVRYLASQATKSTNPMEFFKQIYKIDAAGKSAEEFINELASKITNLNGRDFKELLGSFYVAAFSQEKTGQYSFYGDPVIQEKITDYPVYMGESGQSVTLEPTSAIVVKTKDGQFTVPSDAGSDVKFFGVTKDLDIFKPAEGDGTSSKPYIIKNTQELNALSKYPNAYFKLGNNIDINQGEYFSADNFYGVLQGNGYSINGLDKALVKNNYGTINNLKINANFNGEYSGYIGTIAEINSGTITDIEVDGSFNISLYTPNKFSIPTFGAVVGRNDPSGVVERTAFNGNATVEMTTSNAIIGGIVAYNYGSVKNSYSNGSIAVSQKNLGTYDLQMGGIIGYYKSFGVGASLRNSYSIASLTYNDVNNTSGQIGQLIGAAGSTPYIIDSYGLDNIDSIGNDPARTEYKRSLTQLQDRNNFINWDFAAVWKMALDGDRTPVFLSANESSVVNAKLSKDTYFIGEKLSLINAKITVNGTEIPLEEYMLDMSEFDSKTEGNSKVINGTYKGNNFTVTYNVKKPTNVDDLQVVNQGKVTYFQNEMYSTEGVVLKAKLDGQQNYTYIYSGFTSNLSNPLQGTDKSVKLTYVNKDIDININVVEKKISSITTLKEPNKSVYAESQLLDLTGARFQITYNDGSKSPVFGPKEFSAYNLYVAQANANGSNVETVDLNKELTVKDNDGKTLYLYYDSLLPGQSGAIFTAISKININTKIAMKDETFRAVLGQQSYLWSEPLLYANYDVTTTVKSGTLPDGIVAAAVPDKSANNSFKFQGTATKLGTYVITYTITRDNGDSTDVTFTFNVENISNEPLLEALTLKKAHNKHLNNDIEGIIDNVNDTIVFTVPFGTDITNLKPTPTYYKGSTLEQDRWNGAAFDFTKGPVLYKVTAEDGITTKTYEVSVVVLPETIIVQEVRVSPDTVEIEQGKSHQFNSSVVVNGFEDASQIVTWTVEGNNSIDTIINSNGELTVGADETSTILTVRATSNVDPTKSGIATVSVKEVAKPTLDKVDGLVWDDKVAKWNAVNNATSYEVIVLRDNVVIATRETADTFYDLSEFFNETGKYSFRVIAKADGYNNSGSTNISNENDFVKNSEPEIIAYDKEIKVGQSFDAKLDVTAKDKEDGDISNRIVVIEDTVDTNKVGEYKVTYEVTDDDGATVRKTITVKVVSNDKPVISGAEDITIELGSNFDKYAGVTVTDTEDKDIASKLVVTGDVDVNVEGAYEITYSVTDSDGNNTTVIRKVTVEAKVEEKPEVPGETPDGPGENPEVPGETPEVPEEKPEVPDEKPEIPNSEPEIIAYDKVIKVGQSFDAKLDVTAKDKEDGDISNKIVVIENTVDTNKVGEYKVTYEVTDNNGATVRKTITVKVVSNDKPVISGAEDITIELGSNFDKYAGVTVTDTEDKDIASKLVVTGAVDVNVEGVYEITYSVTDLDGNITTVIRKVTVKAKSEEKPEVPGITPGTPGTTPGTTPGQSGIITETQGTTQKVPSATSKAPNEIPEVPSETEEVQDETQEVSDETSEVSDEILEVPSENIEIVLPEEEIVEVNLDGKLNQTGKITAIICVAIGILMAIVGVFVFKKKKK